MGALFLHVLFAGVAAVLGATAGWWIRGSGLRRAPEAPAPQPVEPAPAAQPEQVQQKPGLDAVEDVMSRLHQLTESVAADVGEHNSIVQEINHELSAADNQQADVITIVEKLLLANDDMQAQLQAAEGRLQEQAQEIESHVREARTDALTKLFNRRAFDDEMRKLVERYARDGKTSCVLMMDVDHFKKFNDTYGHQAGDEVLRGVARVLRRTLKSKEIICRYGGEEFAVIFPGLDIEAAIPAAERAREAIGNQVFEFEGMDLKVSASAGLAELLSGEAGKQLVKRADDALYVAKAEGRDCGFWHDGGNSHRISLTVAAETSAVNDAEVFQLVDDEQFAGRRDHFSDLSSREAFLQDVERRMSESQRRGSTLAVLLVQIDDYEEILAEYGSKAVEIVTRAAAQFLKATMRDMDHIARFDEQVFALMLPGAGITETSSISERLRGAVEKCMLPVNGEQLMFTVSLGAAEVADSDERDDLIERAQASLRAAMDAGGNVSFATTEEGSCRAMAFL